MFRLCGFRRCASLQDNLAFCFLSVSWVITSLECAPFLFFTEQNHVISLVGRNSSLELHHIGKKWEETCICRGGNHVLCGSYCTWTCFPTFLLHLLVLFLLWKRMAVLLLNSAVKSWNGSFAAHASVIGEFFLLQNLTKPSKFEHLTNLIFPSEAAIGDWLFVTYNFCMKLVHFETKVSKFIHSQ